MRGAAQTNEIMDAADPPRAGNPNTTLHTGKHAAVSAFYFEETFVSQLDGRVAGEAFTAPYMHRCRISSR